MPAEEVHANADETDRYRHCQHIDGCGEMHRKDPLEECHDQHHDDDFDDLVLEVIEVLDIQEAAKSPLNTGDIDIGDEELVDTETEDDEDKTDEVKVHGSNDPDQDIFMGDRVV